MGLSFPPIPNQILGFWGCMIPSESLPGSEQGSTAGTLSPSLMHLQKTRKPGSNPPAEWAPHLGSHAHTIAILATPWGCCHGSFSPPGKLTRHLPPFPAGRQVEERQERAADPPAHTHTHATHPFCLPLSPLPLPPSPPHSRPPRCLIPGWLMALQVPAGMDALTLGFSSRNPLKPSCCCFALPSPPLPGCWKTENGGSEVGNPG